MILHIFNPEHDIALAAHRPRFTAPRAGRQLRHDLGFLPTFWAAPDDLILVDDPADATRRLRPWAGMSRGRLVDGRTLASLLREGITPGVAPWGWDVTLRQQLLDYGLAPAALPADGQLELWRQMSHRAWAARHLLPLLREMEGTVGEAAEMRSMDELRAWTSHRGPVVLKAPWSSSGRGLRYLRETDEGNTPLLSEAVAHWTLHIIERQGAVMAEPLYDRMADVGMEFESDGRGGVTYRGLSVFATEHGAYVGNVLDDEAGKEALMARMVAPEMLAEVRQRVAEATAGPIGSCHAGPFGIDMMVVRGEHGPLLHPCVELNLRRTMGHVALALGQRGARGTMRIAYREGNYDLEVEGE